MRRDTAAHNVFDRRSLGLFAYAFGYPAHILTSTCLILRLLFSYLSLHRHNRPASRHNFDGLSIGADADILCADRRMLSRKRHQRYRGSPHAPDYNSSAAKVTLCWQALATVTVASFGSVIQWSKYGYRGGHHFEAQTANAVHEANERASCMDTRNQIFEDLRMAAPMMLCT
jgi:hypothetical protein